MMKLLWMLLLQSILKSMTVMKKQGLPFLLPIFPEKAMRWEMSSGAGKSIGINFGLCLFRPFRKEVPELIFEREIFIKSPRRKRKS